MMLRTRNHTSLNKAFKSRKYKGCRLSLHLCMLCGQRRGLIRHTRLCWKCVKDKVGCSNLVVL